MKPIQLLAGLALGALLALWLLGPGERRTPAPPAPAATPYGPVAQGAQPTPPAPPLTPEARDEVARLRAELADMKQRFIAFADAASLRQAELEAANTRLRADLAAARKVPLAAIPVPDMKEELRTNRDAQERLSQLEAENRGRVDGYEPERPGPARRQAAASGEGRPRSYSSREEPPPRRTEPEPQREKGFFESLRDAFRPGQPPTSPPYDFVHGG